MPTARSSKIRPIGDCIDDAGEYKGYVKGVLKKAKQALQVASDDVQNSRFEELARVAEKQSVLKFDFVIIKKALQEKIDLGTSTEDLCAAIVKVTAYLEDLAKLLFVLQESRKKDFYAEKAVDFVKSHFTEERTVEQMEEKNKEMINVLREKSKGSATDDLSEEKTQLGNSTATGDNLATIDDELQYAMDQGLKLDIEASDHVLTWGVEAANEIDVCMTKHTISLRPLFKTMFFQGMDNRDDRGWMDDLRTDLNNIVDMNTRVETVMDKAFTLENACGVEGEASESDESGHFSHEQSQPF